MTGNSGLPLMLRTFSTIDLALSSRQRVMVVITLILITHSSGGAGA